MAAAWVLMTAMPPTRGHLDLIRFAATAAAGADELGASADGCRRDPIVHVLVCTQPGEPFVGERPAAVAAAIPDDLPAAVDVVHHHERVQQVPDGEGDAAFWDLWTAKLVSYGFVPGDLLVASEDYGVPLARCSGARFIPYDVGRTVRDGDASRIRADPLGEFHRILPTFARRLTRRVTFFGAESTGKTTLCGAVAAELGVPQLPEWARPYLETVGAEVTDAAMHDIWLGQRSLQLSAAGLEPRPFVLQDTDLFSTLGYWEMYDPDRVPAGLADDALALRSDLYVLCSSDIPFEPDPLRYGGDRRESTDRRWIDLLERFGLPYAVVDGADLAGRVAAARRAVLSTFDPDVLRYDRIR